MAVRPQLRSSTQPHTHVAINAMSCSFIICLSPDVSLVENPDFCLQTPRGSLPLDRLSPELRSVVKTLASSGATEAALREPIAPSQWIEFYHLLAQLLRLGLSEHVLQDGDRPLARRISLSDRDKARFPAIDPQTSYRLSRFAYSRSENGLTLLESPLALAQIAILDWRCAAILGELSQPQTCETLQQQIPHLTSDLVEHFFSLLCGLDCLIEISEEAMHPEFGEALRQWEFHDLLFHTRSRIGRHRNPFGKTYPFRGKIEPLPAIAPLDPSRERIPLHKPDLEQLKASDISLTQALETRRSVRAHGLFPLTAKQLGEFLYRSASIRSTFKVGTVEKTQRPYPGGGACHELEIYLAIRACEGINGGFYHYCPQAHLLEKIPKTAAELSALLDSARRAALKEEPPQVLIVIAARFARFMWEYRTISYASILKHVGVLFQTMYLVATAMELAPCSIGAGDPDLFAAVVKTNYYFETSVGEFMLGSRA